MFTCDGPIEFDTSTIDCEVQITIPDITDGDTLCVVTCSGSICDTTIIIIDPVPPTTDTIYIEVPVNEESDVLCGTGDDIISIETSESLGCDIVLLDGSTLNEDANGCVTYIAGNTPGANADTVCMVAYDGHGGSDTTIYIVSVVPVTDTLPTPPDTILCIDDVVTVGGPIDTIYACDGSFVDFDTTSSDCEVQIIIPDITDGDTLCVITCSGEICDTTIIIVDPVLPATDTVYVDININESTDPLCGTGDDIDAIDTSIALNCDGELLDGVVITTDANGCVIYSADNTPGYFADTICVVAVDLDGSTDTTVYIVSVLPEIDTVVTPPGIELCIDDVVTVGGPVDTVFSCDGSSIDVISDSLGCEVAIDIPEIEDGDTLCVVSCSGEICDTTIIIVEPVPPVTDTIHITIPIEESTDILCGTGDDIEDIVISNSLDCDEELLEGSIVSTDANGCVIYTADITPGYFGDTLCIVAVDANGATDTTVYIISVIPITDTITVPTDTIVCIDDLVTVGGAVDTIYSCDGSEFEVVTNSDDCEIAVVIDDEYPSDSTELCVVTCSGPMCDTTIIIIVQEGFPPVAVDDYDTTLINEGVTIPILENDYDPDNDSIVIIDVITDPENGIVTDIDFVDGTVTYEPNAGYTGVDSFQYVICDIPQDGCDTAWVYITIRDDQCLFPQAITPNGDGQNDYFEISCLEGQPNIELRIFNRWGNEIYHDLNYQNDWDGQYDGKPLPDGAYYYVIEYNDVDTNERMQRGGYIMIHR